MPQPQLLTDVVRVFERLDIDYMLTGSLVSSLQGEPRATHDIDFVVDLKTSQISELLASFPQPMYYLDETALRNAVRQRGMANLIDARSGEKVDFWLLTEEPFDASRFQRRRLAQIGDLTVPVSTPEDTILAKLRWARLCGGSERQMGDVLRVHEVQGPALDQHYIEHWAMQLGVIDLWREIVRQSEPLA